MKLLSIELYNFRNIEHRKFDFINRTGDINKFMTIIGDNGVGKTSILEGITKGYTPIVRTISKHAVEKCDLNDGDIKNDKKWTAIKLEVKIDEEIYTWINKRRKTARVEYPEYINQQLNLKSLKDKYEERRDENKLPLVLYYGTDRVVKDIPKRGHIREFKIEDSLKHCFDNVNYFRDFYDWFKTEEDIELREKQDNINYQSIKINCVRDAIERMIPGYKNLRIRLNPSRMIITNNRGENLRIEQLSGGFKAVISMVSDIAKRLALANPNSRNPLDEEAIILIDELDLHLHPKWQKVIVGDLRRTFPNCQFIITTHSPFIIQSLEKKDVINLEKEEWVQNGSYEGWSIEEIQENEMLVESKTAKYKRLIQEFSDAIDDDDSEKAKRMYKELKDIIHPQSVEHRIMEIDMAGVE